ncbi:MAG: hypothetical protein ACLGSH_12890 [Acidobacteriota bacterium]
MLTKLLATRVVGLFFVILLGSCGRMAAQPSHCAQILFCLFNQEAAARNPAGIHKYSEDLIGLLVPNPSGDGSIRQIADRLANRLSNAEKAARVGDGRLVPEAAVVKAFNDLMNAIGAPASIRASEASVHEFRDHAASLEAFPALLSADDNGSNCNPGEAVFLLYLLISGNGILHGGNLDGAQALIQMNSQGIESYGTARMEGLGLSAMEPDSSASGLLSSYPSHHSRNATIALFNHVAGMLGF